MCVVCHWIFFALFVANNQTKVWLAQLIPAA
jgi:hypothetical protein